MLRALREAASSVLLTVSASEDVLLRLRLAVRDRGRSFPRPLCVVPSIELGSELQGADDAWAVGDVAMPYDALLSRGILLGDGRFVSAFYGRDSYDIVIRVAKPVSQLGLSDSSEMELLSFRSLCR